MIETPETLAQDMLTHAYATPPLLDRINASFHNLERKQSAGTFDRQAAFRLLRNNARDIGRSYHKTHYSGRRTRWQDVATPDIRDKLESALLAEFERDR